MPPRFLQSPGNGTSRVTRLYPSLILNHSSLILIHSSLKTSHPSRKTSTCLDLSRKTSHSSRLVSKDKYLSRLVSIETSPVSTCLDSSRPVSKLKQRLQSVVEIVQWHHITMQRHPEGKWFLFIHECDCLTWFVWWLLIGSLPPISFPFSFVRGVLLFDSIDCCVLMVFQSFINYTYDHNSFVSIIHCCVNSHQADFYFVVYTPLKACHISCRLLRLFPNAWFMLAGHFVVRRRCGHDLWLPAQQRRLIVPYFVVLWTGRVEGET